MRLYNVAYCENFACNIVSLRVLNKQGYAWDNEVSQPGQNFLRRRDGSIVCKVLRLHEQFVIEDIPYDVSRQSFTRRDRFNTWTTRRPNPTEHLVNQSKNARIKGPTTVECDHCAVSKAFRSIRRERREFDEGPGLRLAIDFHDMNPDNQGFKSVMLVTDRWFGYIWDFYFTGDRDSQAIITALTQLFGILKRQHNIEPRVIESDREIYEVKPAVKTWIESQHIKIEPSAARTQEQNGAAERSGGVIKNKTRAMSDSSRLPEWLWVEIYKAGVYLYNRTPIYTHNWRTPYDRFHTYLAMRDGIVTQDKKTEPRPSQSLRM